LISASLPAAAIPSSASSTSHAPEYVARRDAINAELSALAPGPIPDLDQASKVLEDFTIFWSNETDPTNKRQFLNLIFDGVWLDDGRVVAVQPKPSFLPFFEKRREEPAGRVGVKYGSFGTSCEPGSTPGRPL
jgi:hypothetical protein